MVMKRSEATRARRVQYFAFSIVYYILILDSKVLCNHYPILFPLPHIMVDEQKIIPLFHPPHLLKCVRNNLLTKDLRYTLDGVERTAKWSPL